MHDRASGVADLPGPPDHGLDRGEVVHRYAEHAGDRIRGATGPAAQHALRVPVAWFLAAHRGPEAECAGDIAGDGTTEAADEALDAPAGTGERFGVLQPRRRFRKRQDGDRAARNRRRTRRATSQASNSSLAGRQAARHTAWPMRSKNVSLGKAERLWLFRRLREARSMFQV